MMKKILAILLIAVVMTGCSQNKECHNKCSLSDNKDNFYETI